MPARDWAEAAISCAAALVSCVEAETCSAAALDSSETLATSVMSASARPVLGADLLDGGGDRGHLQRHVLDAQADLLERFAGGSTVATPSWVR